MYEEDVDGIIIGGDDIRYEWWTEERLPHMGIYPHKIAAGSFDDDKSACDWFAANYPEHWRRGCEMRVYDR